MVRNHKKNSAKYAGLVKRIWALLLAAVLLAGVFPAEVSASPYVGKIASDAKVKTGYYRLIPSCASARTLSVAGDSKKSGANLYIYKKNAQKTSQIFYIKSEGSGRYTIKNVNSGMYAEVQGGSYANRANIRQASRKTSQKRQKWYILKKDGKYVIQSSYCKKVMTVQKSGNADKTNVYTYSFIKIPGQYWKLEAVSASTVKKLTAPAKTTAKSTASNTASTAKTATTAKTTATKTTTTTTSSKTTATSTSTAAAAASKVLKALSGYGTSSRVWSDSKDLPIMTNIIGAVESGGQVYGKRDYSAYAAPYANSSIEYTCTLGWAQFYGTEAKTLITNIYKKNPTAFKKIVDAYYPVKTDKAANTAFMDKLNVSYNWVSKKYNPESFKNKAKTKNDKGLLIKLITSDVGKKCQDELFQSEMKSMISYCQNYYTKNAWAVQMYCEIRHLGGMGAANRIFNKCKNAKSYSLGMIMAALKEDQADKSSSNQVGDLKFWTRHLKCAEFLMKYAA